MPRFAYELPIAIVSGAGVAEPFDAHTRDVSAGGLFFYADVPLHVGSTIEIVMDLPTLGMQQYMLKVRCSAKVVRVEKLEYGKTGIAVQTQGFEFLPAHPSNA